MIIFSNETRLMISMLVGAVLFSRFFLTGIIAEAQNTAAESRIEPVVLPLSVSVNKALVLRLPKPARRISLTQTLIAEAIILAPDLILVNGKNIGTTSLVVWFDEPAAGKKFSDKRRY